VVQRRDTSIRFVRARDANKITSAYNIIFRKQLGKCRTSANGLSNVIIIIITIVKTPSREAAARRHMSYSQICDHKTGCAESSSKRAVNSIIAVFGSVEFTDGRDGTIKSVVCTYSRRRSNSITVFEVKVLSREKKTGYYLS